MVTVEYECSIAAGAPVRTGGPGGLPGQGRLRGVDIERCYEIGGKRHEQ